MKTWVLRTLGALALTALQGCGDDAHSPTAPAVEPQALAKSTSTPLLFRQVSTSSRSNTCGVTADGRAYCWGNNNRGQLGTGTSSGPEHCQSNDPCSTRPKAVEGGLRFRSISPGGAHTCGVARNHRAYCWGYNGNGQVGDGTTTDRTTPTPVAGGLRFRQVSAGLFHSCGITTAGRAFCWGHNLSGQLGDSTEVVDRLTPVRVSGGHHYRQIDAGDDFNCAVTNQHRAFCWGRGDAGELGIGRSFTSRWPLPVAGGLSFALVSAGVSHVCGVALDQDTYCWGGNENGQLGNGTKSGNQFVPGPVLGGMVFEQVSAGAYHTCGWMTSGRAFCWGRNLEGQLGGPDLFPLPTAVAGGQFFDQVSAGGFHTCGVTAGIGEVLCWGGNESGQLGDGTTTNRPIPTRIAPLT